MPRETSSAGLKAMSMENKNKAFDPGESFSDESGNGKRDTNPLIELSSLPKLIEFIPL